MIHVLVSKHKDSKYPALVHFQSIKEANAYYRDGIPGDVIANKDDLRKLKSKYKETSEVSLMLETIDEAMLDGGVYKLDENGFLTADQAAKSPA